MINRAVFFDRDGVVNKRIIGGYVTSIDEFVFLPEFFTLFKLVKQNFLAILITNQQGLGKNLMTEKELSSIHSYMQYQLRIQTGYSFDDISYCGDLAESNSFRRKPNPGMLLEAMERWNINPKESFMIGDNISDYLAAINANINPILIGNFDKSQCPNVYNIVNDLEELIEFFSANILNNPVKP